MMESKRFEIEVEMGDYMWYVGSQRVIPPADLGKNMTEKVNLKATFKKPEACWIFTLYNSAGKLAEYSLPLAHNIRFNFEESIITWANLKGDPKRHIYIIDDDWDNSLITKFADIFSNAYKLAGSTPSFTNEPKEKDSYTSKWFLSSPISGFIQGFVQNRVIALRGNGIHQLALHDTVSNSAFFNEDRTIDQLEIEPVGVTITKGIFINLESELAYLTDQDPQEIKVYNFIERKIINTHILKNVEKIEWICEKKVPLSKSSLTKDTFYALWTIKAGSEFKSVIYLITLKGNESEMVEFKELKKGKGRFIHISTDHVGKILCSSDTTYMYAIKEDGKEGDSKIMKVWPPYPFGAELYTDKSKNSSYMFSTGFELRYIYKKPKDAKDSIHTTNYSLKASDVTDKEVKFSIAKFIYGSESLMDCGDSPWPSYIVGSIDNKIIIWKMQNFENGINDYETRIFTKLSEEKEI